jgi:AhpD family alkylhydroperoxidase
MKERISFAEVSPQLMNVLMQTEKYIKKSGISIQLMELVKYRVSQINGCAYCLDMHHKEAIHHGESELRLHALPAWRECPYYSDKERVALDLAETLTLISKHVVTDNQYETLSAQFSKQEITDLTLLINQINLWNRFMKVFATTPGNYQVEQV